jgi:MEDS: MEthanogen/methylotroph, DcmR Sensory domain
MVAGSRKSGISVVGDLSWRTHFRHFCATKQDLIDILVPYFKAGLENNEFCMWMVFDPRSEEGAREALRAALPGADRKKPATHVIVRHSETGVLFTSGYTEDVIVHHGALDDEVAFLGEPYSPSTLAGKIREVLRKAG